MKRLLTIILTLTCCLIAHAQRAEFAGKCIKLGEAATQITTGQWYVMKNCGRSAYIRENASNGLYMDAANPEGRSALDGCGYLVRFEESGTPGQYYLQTGYGNYFSTLTNGSNNGTVATEPTPYSYGEIATAHFYFRDPSFIMDGNAAGGTLAGWGTNVPTTTGGHNDYQLLPVTLTDANFYTPNVASDCTISISATPASKLAVSTSAEDNDHWYLLVQKRNDGVAGGTETPVYDNGNEQRIKRAATSVTPASLSGSTASDALQYLVRFIPGSTDGTCRIQFATGRFVDANLNTSLSNTEFVVYNINNEAGHFGINLGDKTGKKVDNNGPGYNIAFWESGETTTTGGNNDWTIYPADIIVPSHDMAAITYVYVDGHTELYREVKKAMIGDDYPDLHDQPAGIKYDNIPSGKVSGEETIVINCSVDSKNAVITQYADSYDNAKWLYLCLHNNNYHLQYNSSNNFITVNTSLTVRPQTDNYAYQWAFIGNPFTGFKIVNRLAGKGMILVSPAVDTANNTGGNTYPIMMAEEGLNTADYNATWDATNYGLGFTLSRQGESVMLNNRNGKLAYWTNVDGGSTFSAERVDLALATTSPNTTDKQLKNRYTGRVIDLSELGDYNIFCEAEDGYYHLVSTTSTAVGTSEHIALCDNNGTLSPWTTWNHRSQWQLIDADKARSVQVTALADITSGKSYRFVNVGTPSKAMSETDGKVRGSIVDEFSARQVWTLTGSQADGFTFKSLMTGHYIQASNSTNVYYPYTATDAAGKAFKIGMADASNAIFYVEGNTTTNGLNYNNDYDAVVNWQWATDNGSRWTIYEVLNTDELAADIDTYNEMAQVTTDDLLRFFTDKSCTTLKSAYNALTDEELRTTMSALPIMVQDMAVAVKNQTWNSDKSDTYNQYERDFRIADYEVYTNCNWNEITKVGPFAMLYNPSGITVHPGQTFMVMVGSNVAASDAALLLHIVSDTNRTPSQTVTLNSGLNVILAEAEGEVFIDYTLNNAPNGTWNGHATSQYPDITVHIEGGQCSGMWDMHRGMTNNDWLWLKNNMLTSEFLHVKGHSTLLNLKTDLVTAANKPVEIMKAWDFVFDTEESLAGCDQWRKTGAYKPLINPRHSYSGSPNWDGRYGTNHPDLTASSIFNYENLYNTGENGGALWVISHEEGHGHQSPIKLAGTTEQTNNSLANCVNLLWNLKETTLTKRSDRHDGVKGLLERYNQHHFSWVDYASQRDCGDDEFSALWIANKWFYQLWLYFDFLGNYQPQGGNTGFSFVTELFNRLRADGISYSSNSTSPAPSTNDYLKLAKHCADIAQADLSEYFDIWGFFQTAPVVANTDTNHPDLPASNTWYLGDYGSYYIQTNADDAAAVKAYMQNLYGDNKLSNIVFIEGRGGEHDTWLTYNNEPATSFGETGFYATFMDGITKGYAYSLSGNTVTMTQGAGAVGFKVYDNTGQLKWVSNFNSFDVSDDVATGLRNGTLTLKVAAGTGKDLALGEVEKVTIGQLTKAIRSMLEGDPTITKPTIQTLVNKVLERNE